MYLLYIINKLRLGNADIGHTPYTNVYIGCTLRVLFILFFQVFVVFVDANYVRRIPTHAMHVKAS